MRSPAAVAFVVLGTVWGSNFLFMKWAAELISPGQITLLRVLFGLLPVTLYAVARGAFRRAHLRHVHHFVAMSLLATSVYYFAFAAGTDRLPSGIAGALSGAIPLFAFLGAAVFLRTEPITGLRVLGVALGFAGMLAIARPWESTGPQGVDPAGVGWMLVGSASVGLSFVYARKFVSDLRIAPAALTTYQMALALLGLLLVTDLDGITAITDEPRALWGMVLGLGLMGTGVAFILYYFVVDRLGAVTAAGSTYIPPVIALLLGWLVADEALAWLDAAAVALVLTGVLLLRRPAPVAATRV
ncbi:DMT family transporter [Nocardioides sp. GCM10027113]|uniref:DMT family transporter n=1 Tax=unclassified Nocardioides TaxID=2615069 RepID=UPI00360BAF9F